MYQDQTDGDLDDIIVSMSDADKMSIFLPSIKELDEEDQGLDDYHKMLVKFINFETGKSLETIEDFGHIELLNELSGELRKFNVKMNCRKILGFHRLKNIGSFNINSNSRQKPIPPGIFKGKESIWLFFHFLDRICIPTCNFLISWNDGSHKNLIRCTLRFLLYVLVL